MAVEPDSLSVGLVLSGRHPIVTVSFEEAITSPARLFRELKREATAALGAKLVGEAGKFVSATVSEEGVRLVFTKGAERMLESGEWTHAFDRATGFRRAEARDLGGRVREGARYRQIDAKTQAAIRGAVAIAHAVSAIDTQLQLERIAEKIDALSDFVHAERSGELRGVYLSLQKAMADPKADSRSAALQSLSRKLDELQGRFFESAKVKFSAISDPSDISPIKAYFSLQTTAESELRESLQRGFADLRQSEFCHQLNSMIHVELGQRDALKIHQAAFAQAFMAVRDLLTEKAAYLSAGMADITDAKVRALASGIRLPRFHVGPTHQGESIGDTGHGE